ncbi:uncharacterized protein EV420DRAFT_453571 [Desarmillaria tabescens]|uniref:Uncharacterized protein n=1 Tax=Armillaria tabescens TaxID=1929756 RepID=A0AA39NMA5_ARMTA|nr:uncharacterized protein EV420DRAFT_453571 [Desarmillaria tabescens]KAK0468246.1 hypothetical protein EV420DRAFT_453571 [Desarmillaria tabescens]
METGPGPSRQRGENLESLGAAHKGGVKKGGAIMHPTTTIKSLKMTRALAIQSSRRMHMMHLPHIEGIKGRPVSTGVITCAGAMVVAYTAYNVWRGERTAVRRMKGSQSSATSPEICREGPARIKEADVGDGRVLSGRDVVHEDKTTVPERMGPGKSGIIRRNIDPQGKPARTNVRQSSVIQEMDKDCFYNLWSCVIST